MATRKPFAAFGHVLYANYYDTGEQVDIQFSSTSKTVVFVSDGNATARDKTTNQVQQQVDTGWFRTGDYTDDLHTYTCNVPTVCWCYDPLVNQNYIPLITPVIIKQGDTANFDINTKLFLCTGTLGINDKNYTGPYQLAIRTGAVTVTALTDVYGLEFK
jgi:hypothetical protein